MTKTLAPIVPIILAGGKGTRLWPMSRAARPKQFLPLVDEISLFQDTLLRVAGDERYAPPIVVTNANYRFLVAEQALECGVALDAILLEPCARNTAPAIAAACEVVLSRSPDNALVHVMPSDHKIEIDAAYNEAVNVAIAAGSAGKLVTFGIKPTEPATGFGYIEAGKSEPNGARRIARFVEKPDAKTAAKMIAQGDHYWNSGMFVFGAQAFVDECQRLAPLVHGPAQKAVTDAQVDLDFLRLDETAFAEATSISVDYAIFEKTDKAAIVPVDLNWSDLGAWDAVWKASRQDKSGNSARGPVQLSNTKNSLAISEKALLVIDGLDDVVAIATEDAVLITRLSAAQNVGGIVKTLETQTETQPLTQTHRTSYRPWGGYASVLNGERFQVKRLFVKPGKSLSLQKHHHRSEHWVVVRGTAQVQVGEEITMLAENESIYVPQGDVHRLTNPGKILLELIEVQTGSYLGEDDIIRIEDEFDRT